MSFKWLRRAAVLAACTSSLLLAACGSSSVESQLQPSRVIAFGDAMADLGQGGSRYTVNDNTLNIWTEQVAFSYGLSLANVSKGGASYAQAHARVAAKPDAVGSNTTLTIKEQIDSFLASGAPGGNDLVIVNAGTADIIAEMAKVKAGTQTNDQMVANVRQAGRDLGGQVRRLVQAGGKFVVVVGPYNLGKSPWAAATNQAALLESVSSGFNEQLLVSIVDLGANVLYVDAPLEFNLFAGEPSSYSLNDGTSVVCTSVDAGVGIGIGTGEVNSAQCTTSTIASGLDYTKYLWADKVYPTPRGHSLFGTYAYGRIRSRW